jgi:tetratricopeptide (TPR) repeat protein
MSEPLDFITESDILLAADYPDNDELPTNQLGSGNLTQQQSVAEEIDWLLKLRTRNLTTQELPDSALLRPSGMAAHTAPVKIVPTLGARFTTGLRRGMLMIVLAVLVIGALAGGGYLLASTSWLSDFATPTSPAPSGASAQTQLQPAPLPDTSAMRDSHDTTREPIPPQGGAGQSADSSAESSALSGLDARNLRDKGIAAYKEGNYTDAVKYLDDSISIDSEDPVAQYQLGLSYMAVQNRDHSLEDAELAFRTAISLQPGWSAPYQMVAETLMRRGYYEQAVAPALQATQIAPTMADAWMTLGRAYSGAGKDAEATRAFAQAAKYAPAPPQP